MPIAGVLGSPPDHKLTARAPSHCCHPAAAGACLDALEARELEHFGPEAFGKAVERELVDLQFRLTQRE
eukprot:6912701-Lingulodinium_polyedra.AAC.1